MNIKLIFYDWINEKGESVSATEKGIELFSGDIHSGTVFSGYICAVNPHVELSLEELEEAVKQGCFPLFQVIPK